MGRLRLRRWQKHALEAFETRAHRDFLAVATPGAGKTTFALTAVVRDLAHHPHRPVIVVTPTLHLKHQWAEAASVLGLHLEPQWRASDGWPGDMHGIVVTYQQVASSDQALRRWSDDAFVVLDEIHHAGTDRAWGSGVAVAFEPAAHRLSLSGTPFRSDEDPIPFVRYDFDEAVADYTYDYGAALTDGGVVRPVFFPAIGGHMEWTTPDGTLMNATFDDPLDRIGASQRLRTALSADGEWLPTVLEQAHGQVMRLRAEHPDAAGLAIAMDVDHAHAIRRLLSRLDVDATVATSDDPLASEKIAEFAAGSSPWIVAVRMVSEGVDIPRLRVGVYATNIVTDLFFRQAVGRIVRWHGRARRQKAFMFLPDDVRLRTLAHQVGQARTHSLRRREDDGTQPPVELDGVAAADDDQLSLFSAISATPQVNGDPSSVFDDAHPEDLIVDDATFATDPDLEIDLAPPPPRGAADHASLTVSRTRRKRELRQANADRARIIGHLSGLTPEAINAQLNAAAGITAVAEATIRELEIRLAAADRWIDQA